MAVSIEKCDECREYHHPGPCYPPDDERDREDGWRLYKATKTMTFKHADEAGEDSPC